MVVLQFMSSGWLLVANDVAFVNADGCAQASEEPQPLIVGCSSKTRS